MTRLEMLTSKSLIENLVSELKSKDFSDRFASHPLPYKINNSNNRKRDGVDFEEISHKKAKALIDKGYTVIEANDSQVCLLNSEGVTEFVLNVYHTQKLQKLLKSGR
jgi:hypothetical protein